MKRIVKAAAAVSAALAGLAALSSCNNGKQISGTFSDIQNDSLAFYLYEPAGECVLADTVVAQNGNFEISFKDTAVFLAYIFPLDHNGQPNPAFILPGEKLKVSGTADAPVYSGTEIYDGLAGFHGFQEIQDEFEALFEKNRTVAEDDIVGLQNLNAAHEALVAKRDSIYSEYIKNNPNSLTSGYLTLFMNPEAGLESYGRLGDKVKKSSMGSFLSYIAEAYKGLVEKEKNKANVQPGKPAPEFCLKDMDGNERTLASFRGKYVLLDFWGEWCYWCMKGMPDMKKYYDKYSSKIEFVGINCRDSEETWKKTVKEQGLKWTNLYNGNGEEILVKYAVQGFPTKVLIDKDGNIVDVFVGESEDLYNKLDELF